jgi:hypothetical protein
MILMLTAIPSLGQTQSSTSSEVKCNLSLTESPSIRGVHLGMNKDDLLAVFPGSNTDIEIIQALESAKHPLSYGVARVDFVPVMKPYGEKHKGINQYSVRLFDGKVVEYSVYYNGPQWNTVNEFIDRCAGVFHLPSSESWQQSGDPNKKTLSCKGFNISISVQPGGRSHSVSLLDTSAEQKIKARKAETLEKERREFKP